MVDFASLFSFIYLANSGKLSLAAQVLLRVDNSASFELKSFGDDIEVFKNDNPYTRNVFVTVKGSVDRDIEAMTETYLVLL